MSMLDKGDRVAFLDFDQQKYIGLDGEQNKENSIVLVEDTKTVPRAKAQT